MLKSIFCLVFFLPVFLFSQERELDSLQSLLKNAKTDADRINTLSEIGNYFREKGSYTEALNYYIKSLDLSKEKGNKKGMAGAYNNIGVIYESQGNYPEGINSLFEALKIYDELGDKLNAAATYLNVGIINMNQANYPEALKNCERSLEISKKAGHKVYIGYGYNTTALVYYLQNNYKEALKNHELALKYRLETKDPLAIAGSYTNMGIIYYAQGIEEETKGNKQAASEKYKLAEKNYLLAEKILNDEGDGAGIAMSYINMGSLNSRMKNFSKAREYLTKGLELYKEIGSKEGLKESFNALTELDSLQGDFKNAYIHHKLYVAYRDSLVNQDNTRKTLQAQMQYDFDKKTTADSILVAEEKKIAIIQSRQERTQRYALIVGLLLVAVFAVFMFNRFKISQKQKGIIEEQKHIVEEKHKEITDSINYAQRIQYSLLANKKLLNEHLSSEDRDHFVLFLPKDVVSGDFYWASVLSNGNFALVTADSTGHGVPGAIMSMLNMSSLNEAVNGAKLNEPAAILNYTRAQIINHLSNDGSEEGGKDGMDCSLVSFDFKNRKISLAAANNPVWMIRGKEFVEFKPDKMPVGKHDKQNVPFTQQATEILPGDIIYTLTDGLPDQFGGPKGKKFMYKQLKDLLLTVSDLPMQEQRKRIFDTLMVWKKDLEQVDDICVIGVRV